MDSIVDHLLFFSTVAVAAVLFALLEIQIEGRSGWARSLPTWRVRNRWTRWFLGGRTITGYHVYVHLFVLLVCHLPFLLAIAPFSWAAEFRILGFLFLFWVLEDFLWFVLNPHWGLHRFRPEHVPWHAENWWWIMPRDYWIFTPIGLALYLLSWM
jgi:hypothetical protein